MILYTPLTRWHNRSLFFVFFFVLSSISKSQEKKWDGEAGDSAWNNPLNWVGNQVPTSTDSVLLDNSALPGNYVVKLPSGTTAIVLHHLTIWPERPNLIELQLPVSNNVVPAFSTNGKGGIKLYEGALFRNASGASSGTPITLTDSIYIYNGGRFLQQTATAHASIVTSISRSVGTETGSFEFDVPGHASYTVSITGRTYGNLLFSATAAGGVKTYLSTGSSASKIRGQLKIGSGVNFNLNFSGSVTIEKDLILNGSWNLSTGSLSPTVYLKGGLQTTGELTESGSGLPVVELAGSQLQDWEHSGTIKNNVSFRLNNSNGLRLLSPVTLPYKLQLLQGKLLTSWTELLTMGENGWVEADSVVGQSYIKGPLRKQGLKNLAGFYFPVGGEDFMRGMGIQAASGDLAVEYKPQGASTLPGQLTGGLVRVSQKEHWKIRVDSFLLGALELSFRSPYSGAISDFNSLSVGLNCRNAWNNLGHASHTGSVTGLGSVSSILYENFDTGYQYCSLAGELVAENLLPLHRLSLNGKQEKEWLQLFWHSEDESSVASWQLQAAAPDGSFSTFFSVPGGSLSQYKLPKPAKTVLYRVKALDQNGESYFSNVWKSNTIDGNRGLIKSISPQPGGIKITMELSQSGLFEFQVFTLMGKRILNQVQFMGAGLSSCMLPLDANEHGVFVLQCYGADGFQFSRKFIY